MSLRHLLGPETNSSFFIIDAYTTNALKFTLILKKNTYSCIVYGHQEIFVKGFEENLYKNISFDNTPKNCIYKARPCEIMYSFRDFICFQHNHTIIKTFPNFPKGWKTCLSNDFFLFISSAWSSSCIYFFFSPAQMCLLFLSMFSTIIDLS